MQCTKIEDVVAARLCTGCGGCAGLAPDRFLMVDTEEHGRRPVRRAQAPAADDRDVLAACPGADYPAPQPLTTRHEGEWGPVIEVWEGHATDPAIRFRGSSGGIATALALFCVERENMAGGVTVRARPDAPLLNESVIARTRADFLAAAGSRYAPASPADRLGDLERSDAPHVFVGKPCDVAAAARAERQRPAMAGKIGVTISIFCAGAPSYRGTVALARRLGARDPASVTSLRYRGEGWPGDMTLRYRDSDGRERESTISYAKGWGETLQQYRPWRCHVCIDHTGEWADLSVGDPWYRPIAAGEAGSSLLVVRTERGRAIVRKAIAAGVIAVERRSEDVLRRSQENLLRTRGAVWGRILASRLLGMRGPDYRGYPLFSIWRRRLSAKQKLQSLAGTVRRVFRRGLRRPECAAPLGRGGATSLGAPGPR